MRVVYQGPHRSGLGQVGRLSVRVLHGVPVELPDALAEQLIAERPDEWSAAPVADPKPSKKSTTSETPAASTED